MDIQAVLNWVWLENRVQDYGYALLTVIFIWAFARPLVNEFLKHFEKLATATQSGFDDFVVHSIRDIRGWVYFSVGLYSAIQWLKIPVGLEKIVQFIFVLAITLTVINLGKNISAYLLGHYQKRKQDDKGTQTATQGLMTLIKALLWTAGLLFLLDNVGVNITTLAAGLGIGGIAVAMASQAILGDLFSSFTIFLDKPFKVGDFIIVGELMGNVEHIGIKTTRVRSLSGEQLVFPNSDLTGSRIRNYERMDVRRVLFTLGFTYDTSAEKLKQIPDIVKNVFQNTDRAKLDRVHFKSFGDFSLNFEIVYYVQSRDYNTYMDIQQQVNLALKEHIEGIGVEFAFPTQTLHLFKQNQ
jgi:small-conductance mechanosensitive channel